MEISQKALDEVKVAFQRYTTEVNDTGMTDNSKETYLLYVDQFIRWINDDFEPGAKLRRRR